MIKKMAGAVAGKIIKIIFTLLVLLSFFNLNILHARLADDLDDMITGTLTNVTNAGVYKTQSGGIAVGGSIRVRVPYKRIQIASITPPKLKSGCGGIDFYWGAFSFINKQELTLLLQAISANAVGYAFEMALEALCPTCNAILKDLSARINKILGMLHNSCYMAKALVNSAVGAFTSAVGQQCERANVEDASKPDRFASRLACIANQGPSMQKVWNEFKSDATALAQKIGLIEAAQNNPNSVPSITYPLPKANIFGNVIMNILNKLNLSREDKELFMSVTGTCIFGKPDNNGSVNIVCYPPLIDLKTIVYGSSDGYIKLYSCTGSDSVEQTLCLSLTETTVSNFTPLLEKIKTELNDIANKIIVESPPGNMPDLTSEEKNLIELAPTPVLSLFDAVRKNGGIAYIDYIVEHSADFIAVYMGNYYINKIISTLRKYQLTVNMPKAKSYISDLITNAEKNRNITYTAAMEKFKEMYSNIALANTIINGMRNTYSKTKKIKDYNK